MHDSAAHMCVREYSINVFLSIVFEKKKERTTGRVKERSLRARDIQKTLARERETGSRRRIAAVAVAKLSRSAT